MNRNPVTSQMKRWKIISKLVYWCLLVLLSSSVRSAVQAPGPTQIALSQPLIVKWRYQTDETTNLTPAADKTTVFLPLAAGTLIALNASDGKLFGKPKPVVNFPPPRSLTIAACMPPPNIRTLSRGMCTGRCAHWAKQPESLGG